MNFLEQPDGLIVLDVDRRTYAALSRDSSYWHLIQPATAEIARAFDYLDVNGLTVSPVAEGDLTCTCPGGRFKRHCYQLDKARAYERSPIRTARTHMLYRGPSPDVGDAWCRQEGGKVYMTWALTDEERAAIAAGANLGLGIFQTPIPPVSLAVTSDQAITDAGAALADRARAILRELAPRGPLSVPAGFWLVSEDVWQALNTEHALDTTGVPLLVGRPLMMDAGLPPDTLQYDQTTRIYSEGETA